MAAHRFLANPSCASPLAKHPARINEIAHMSLNDERIYPFYSLHGILSYRTRAGTVIALKCTMNFQFLHFFCCF